jgi:hypothetical protein
MPTAELFLMRLSPISSPALQNQSGFLIITDLYKAACLLAQHKSKQIKAL